jgi:2-polyprenyl-3-methyl-5-hydroxy-6-metoxy-1,4-benzoquinol methylase
MSAAELRDVSSVPTGNTFDKYGSSNPAVRRLMIGFERALGEMIVRAAPEAILDVGCGEGVLTARWAERLPAATVVGLDLPEAKLESQWRSRQRPNLRFVPGRAEELPFDSGEFDLVAAVEALEHIPAADRALAEMARVAKRHLLVSIPREPLWRILNVARGAYLSQLGNTPGHVNHWSPRGFQRLLRGHGRIIDLRTPFPWVLALVEIR